VAEIVITLSENFRLEAVAIYRFSWFLAGAPDIWRALRESLLPAVSFFGWL
jgi:hypothetical protein